MRGLFGNEKTIVINDKNRTILILKSDHKQVVSLVKKYKNIAFTNWVHHKEAMNIHLNESEFNNLRKESKLDIKVKTIGICYGNEHSMILRINLDKSLPEKEAYKSEPSN